LTCQQRLAGSRAASPGSALRERRLRRGASRRAGIGIRLCERFSRPHRRRRRGAQLRHSTDAVPTPSRSATRSEALSWRPAGAPLSGRRRMPGPPAARGRVPAGQRRAVIGQLVQPPSRVTSGSLMPNLVGMLSSGRLMITAWRSRAERELALRPDPGLAGDTAEIALGKLCRPLWWPSVQATM